MAFNSLHCLPKANLGQTLRVSLRTGREWMNEKLNMLSNVKPKTGLVLSLCHQGNARLGLYPGNKKERGQFTFEEPHSAPCLQVPMGRV